MKSIEEWMEQEGSALTEGIRINLEMIQDKEGQLRAIMTFLRSELARADKPEYKHETADILTACGVTSERFDVIHEKIGKIVINEKVHFSECIEELEKFMDGDAIKLRSWLMVSLLTIREKIKENRIRDQVAKWMKEAQAEEE